jgi:membrane protein implicated in regulation of membrane protease activity
VAHIEGEIIINRPVETVFDFIADERNEPRYNPRMLRAEKTSDSPIGPGTQFWAETISMGRTLKMIIGITTYERPRRLASSTHMSTMDIHGILTFNLADNGTRMLWSWDVKPHGAFKLMTPLIEPMGKR